MNGLQLYLKPDEIKFLCLTVVGRLETLEKAAVNPRYNLNPEGRKIVKEMLMAGRALRSKLEKLGFDMSDMPPFEDGDEDEFLTKES